MVVCSECGEDLIFYPDIIEDKESKWGSYYCNTKSCINYDKQVYDDGDLIE